MKRKHLPGRHFATCIVGLAALAVAAYVDQLAAKGSRDTRPESRTLGTPMLAIVSLRDQRITIYDADGRRMLQSPVSTGAAGYETPAGIYSVLQKKEVHQSNVYEDGNMPFMQRITWTGIALHAGVLPGYPASHGCVRMPLPFAQSLFGMTDIGLRVIIVRDDIQPREIAHPALFRPLPMRQVASLEAVDRASSGRPSAASSERDLSPGSPGLMEFLKSQAAAKSTEADAATRKAAAARQAAAKQATEAARAAKLVHAAETTQARAEEILERAERAIETAKSPKGMNSQSIRQAKLVRDKAAARLAEAQAQLATSKEGAEAKVAEAQAQLDNANEKAAARFAEARAHLETAREKAAATLADARSKLEEARAQAWTRADDAARADAQAKAAEAAQEVAAEAAGVASLKTSPVSVFVSRKMQRYYVRHGHQPVFEGPVMIRNADKSIGSYVFTALNYRDNSPEARWSVVSMYKSADEAGPINGEPRGRDAGVAAAGPADIAGAKAALDRIAMPQDAIERISEVVLPASSLIISDEGPSVETGKDTDFVVLLSGEPQGGLKTRRREQPRYRDDDFFGSYGRRGGGSFFPFFFPN